MERAELYDDPRLLLEAKLEANGYYAKDALKMIEEMSDEEVKKMLKKYL